MGTQFMIRTTAALAGAALVAVAIGSSAPATASPMPQAPYKNCTQARANDDCDIPSSSDKYQSKLDSDGDGIGCECLD